MDNPETHTMMWRMNDTPTASGDQPPGQPAGTQPLKGKGRRGVLIGGAAVLALGGAGAWYALTGGDGGEAPPATDTTGDTAPTGSAQAQTADGFDMAAALAPRIYGNPDAPVRVAEYFSLSCGHCANFHAGTYKKLKSDWIDTGRISYEFRDFPLTGPAVFAHALARSVPVDAYEGMLDLLFKRQQQWAIADDPVSELAQIARIAGIGRDEFAAILGNRPFLEGIVAIRQVGADDWGVNSTPSFVVNDKDIIRGDTDYDEFVEVFDKYVA